jgi:Holliday junction resolvase RusA-like endonuclease
MKPTVKAKGGRRYGKVTNHYDGNNNLVAVTSPRSKDYVSIKFEVPGVPVAMQRNRSAKVKSGITVNYQPEKTHNFRSLVAMCARSAYKKAPLEGFILCELTFIFQAPKSLRKSDRQKIERGEVLNHNINRDIDNLIKSVLDSVQGIIMRNDNQVVSIVARKVIGAIPKTICNFTTVED